MTPSCIVQSLRVAELVLQIVMRQMGQAVGHRKERGAGIQESWNSTDGHDTERFIRTECGD